MHCPRGEILTERFEQALLFAAQVHAEQKRKGGAVPYVSHLLAVAALVMEAGGDEDECIAALLHDAAEDQGGRPMLEKIEQRFGPRVARIVEACSDSLTEGPDKAPWRQRKQAYLAHLPESSPSDRLVSLADKLHNSRTLLADLRREGAAAFEKFRGKRDGTLWYYRELLRAHRAAQPPVAPDLLDEYERVVTEIERLAAK